MEHRDQMGLLELMETQDLWDQLVSQGVQVLLDPMEGQDPQGRLGLRVNLVLLDNQELLELQAPKVGLDNLDRLGLLGLQDKLALRDQRDKWEVRVRQAHQEYQDHPRLVSRELVDFRDQLGSRVHRDQLDHLEMLD
jgi:hypothetical protein